MLSDYVDVDSSINKYGKLLSEGQSLFHAGLWPLQSQHSFISSRPFSTTFCPQVALRNVEYKAKAYNQNQIDLFVLRVTNPSTKVFAFRRSGNVSFGHENEVLFSSGAELVLRSRKMVRNDYPVADASMLRKLIPIYVLEIDIS